jgi:hypothetical protein
MTVAVLSIFGTLAKTPYGILLSKKYVHDVLTVVGLVDGKKLLLLNFRIDNV